METVPQQHPVLGKRPIGVERPGKVNLANWAATDSNRLNAIEGLRGYLALWVLVCHVLWASGLQANALSGLPKLLRMGEYAVDLFIIVSGFVIFLSLDSRSVSYKQFIVRRFFRLFPLFLILFAIAVPFSRLSLWNVLHATQYLGPTQVQFLTDTMEMWWENIYWNIPLHLLMVHGAIPEFLIADAPGAFLVPAWSVSLEWQFYLIAPFAYALAISSKQSSRLALCGICLLLILGARYAFPTVQYGAALPFHVEYFFLGGASYFLYKRWSAYRLHNVWFSVTGSAAVVLILVTRSLIPVGLWIVFMGAILERSTSLASRVVSPFFTNALNLYLGRISYSIYLTHILIIVVMQHFLLVCAPQLTKGWHFMLLLSSTCVVTIAVSAMSYRFIEAPGIEWGRIVARELAQRRAGRADADRDIASQAALR